jgi:hypothetical protein
MRCFATLLALLLLVAAPAEAQKRCKTGIPCGNACISATKTCRVGGGSSSTQPQSEPTVTPQPLATAAPASSDARWVASSRGSTYYRNGCSAARQLSQANLRFFNTEAEAMKAGYRRSSSRGC